MSCNVQRGNAIRREGWHGKTVSAKAGVRLCAVALAAALAFPSGLLAGDYVLDVGQSDTLSGPETYGTMTIGGDLTVSGGEKITVDEINMAGGSITVTGKDTTLGDGAESATHATTISVTNGADGAYGMLNVHGTGVSADEGLGAAVLVIRKEGEDFTSDGGYFDFMSISNGTANLYAVRNYSSATGRITVAGTSAIYRREPRQNYGIFRNGVFQIRLVDDATLTFNFSQQGGRVNSTGVAVEICGSGTVRLVGSYGSASYAALVNEGAVLNHRGPLVFVRNDNKRDCYFTLADSGVIGPNVTALMQTSGSSSYDTIVTIDSDATITLCGNVQITGTRSRLTGGRIKVDATDAARSFKCNIRSGDSLVVEKTGANEMVVSSTTNIPNLVVSEGTVRFATNDCVVGKLTAATGTALIADGCDVILPPGGEYVGVSFLTVNGGSFVKAGDSRMVIYDPVSVTGALHVANGELAFSKYGFSQKWWRWTFFSVNNGPHGLMHRGLYLFGTDGTWQSPGETPEYVKTAAHYDNPPATALAVNRCRWWRHSTTNITKMSTYKYNGASYLSFFFDYSHNGNNLASLSSPVVNPDDSTSWIGIEWHMPSTALPITGYNMRTHSATYYANGWKVEASSDGLNWETVDVRSNQTFSLSGLYYSYDNKSYDPGTPNLNEFFHFTGYRNGGLATVDPLSVQVDDGATLDLLAFDDGQPVEAITIDFAAGGGTLKGGRIAANGVLNIENATDAALNEALPLALEGTRDVENFASWSVMVNGRLRKAAIACDGSRIRVQLPGIAVIVR